MNAPALVLVRPDEDAGIPFSDTSLTRDQLKVLRLLAQGYRSKQIAASLSIAEQSLSTKVHRAMRRLRARTTIEAVVICMRKGWIK